MFISDLSSYKAGRINPMQRPPVSARYDENEVLQRLGTWENILARCNSLYRNNWFSRAVMFYHIDHIVGSTGLKSVGGSLIANEIFSKWSNSFIDETKTKTFFQMQSEIVKGMVDGDVLVYLADDQSGRNDVSPIVLQLIRAIDIRTPNEFQSKGTTFAGNKIVQGIEFSRYGEEIAYWVKNAGAENHTDKVETFNRIPRFAKNGRLLAFMVRNPDPGMLKQRRSLPVIVAGLQNIEDIAQLEESAVEGGITKNDMSLVYQPEFAGRVVGSPIVQKDDSDDPRVVSNRDGKIAYMGNLQSRSIQVIPDGKITTISNSGNIDMVALLVRALKSACAGIGVTYERLLGDFTGVNYSGGKLSDDKNYRRIGRWASSIGIYFKMIRDVVVYAEMTKNGLVPGDEDYSIKGWQAPPRPDPEPVRTATARKTNDSMGLMLLSHEVQAMYGMDLETFLEIKKQEEESQIAALGRVITSSELNVDPEETKEQV